MIRKAFRLMRAQERRSPTAALGMGVAAILISQVIIPGAIALTSGALSHLPAERPLSP